MDYSWPDIWASVSLQVLRRLMPSTGASALALRQASPLLLFCSVSLRPCTFAVYPSHLCQAKADRHFGVGGPSPKPLRTRDHRFDVFARPHHASSRPGGFALRPKVAPPTVAPRGFGCSSRHPKARLSGTQNAASSATLRAFERARTT